MTAVCLDKSVELLKKSYVKSKKALDKSKVNSLSFDVALFRVQKAIEDNEMTKEDFHKKLEEE